MGRKTHLDHLKEFKDELNRDIPITKMILFGSRAKKKASRWSDFDLVVVSSKFRNKKPRYRGIGFHHYWNLDYPVDFLCYTPEEFEHKKKLIGIVKQAVEEGIEII